MGGKQSLPINRLHRSHLPKIPKANGQFSQDKAQKRDESPREEISKEEVLLEEEVQEEVEGNSVAGEVEER